MKLRARSDFCELFFIVFLFGFATEIFAQTESGALDGGISISEDGSKTIYHAYYFDQYNPLVLEDMLKRIPGASINNSSSGAERRGLRGNEDALLINGQQVTGKDSGGASVIQRITAGEIKQIEIIRGTSNEVQSTTQRIINVVLLENKGATTTLKASFLHYTQDDAMRFNPSITHSVNRPDRNYTLFLNARTPYRLWVRSKLTSDLMGADSLSSMETEKKSTYRVESSGRYEQQFDSGSRLQLNGLFVAENIDRERDEALRDVQAINNNLVFDVFETDKKDEFTAELSADYSFPVNDNDSMTILGLFNWERESRDRNLIDLVPSTRPIISQQSRRDLKTESIARIVYDRALSPKLTAQFGLEGALNTQETDFDLATLINGELVSTPIFNSNGEVTEYRAEAFTTLQWQLSGSFSSELGVAIEGSRIKQSSSDVDNSRQLSFVKPTFSAFWDISQSDKLILSVKRDVQQLDFLEFVANIADRDQELEAGNPDLRPETSWDTEITIEHSLNDGAGFVSASSFYRYVSDVSGRTVFNNLVSQPGNLKSGREYGAKAEISLQFTRLGWWDAALSADYLRRNTSVVDPFDGRSRNFGSTPDWEFNLKYRHDLDYLIDGYLDVSFSRKGENFVYDLGYIERHQEDGSLTLKFLHQLGKNSQIDLTIFNALDRTRVRDREIFTPLIGGGRDLFAHRVEQDTWGRIFALRYRIAL